MPSPFGAQAMPLGQLFADPNYIHVPSYQRSFAWTQEEAGQLLDDVLRGTGCRGRLRPGRRLFPGSDVVYRIRSADGTDRGVEGCAHRARARRSRRPAAPDDPHHPVLRAARPRRGRRRARQRAAAGGHRPGRPGTPGPAGARRGLLPGARARPRGHAHAARRRQSAARGRAHARGAQAPHRDAGRAGCAAAAPARRFPARQVPHRARVGAGYRPRAPHVHGAQRDGPAARPQRHPEGVAAGRRAGRIAAPGHRRVGRGAGPPRHRLRPSVQPYPHDLPAQRDPHHRRHPEHYRRAGRCRRLHHAPAEPRRRRLRRHPQSQARGHAPFPGHRRVAAPSRLAQGRRLDTAGPAVLAGARAASRPNSPGSWRRSTGWRTACASSAWARSGGPDASGP